MDKQQHTTGSFFNGFLIGLIVGAGLVYLLTTKKGKKILKSLSEDGLDKITNLDELMKRFEKVTEEVTSGDEEDEPGSDYVPAKPVLLATETTEPDAVRAEQPAEKKTVTLPPIQINTTGDEKKQTAADADEPEPTFEEVLSKITVDDDENMDEEETITKVKPTRRRFFRGIPKRA
jgi:hypothetical protein